MTLLRRSAWRRALFAIGLLLVVAAPLNLPATARDVLPGDGAAIQIEPPKLTPTMRHAWQQADGPVLDGSASRPLVWGDKPLAIAGEFYRESGTGLRTMAYFDKGRLDVLDPKADRTSDWFVTSAALVREMLAGGVQFGEQETALRPAPEIPVVGDMNQTNALTYRTLALLASLDAQPETEAAPLLPEGESELGQPEHLLREIGQPVKALAGANGTVTPDAVPDGAGVVVGAYDDVTQHNIAAPFVDWVRAQPYPDLWLLGHPLTEPYWVDAVVGGVPQRVLMQAFERRILTFTPANPDGWKVESGNVGLHYRLWRSLAQPTDPALVALAANVPFGEEIVAAAQTNLIDPHLLAAIVLAASHGDPAAILPNGGRGVAGLRPDAAVSLGVPTKKPDKETAEALVAQAESNALPDGAVPASEDAATAEADALLAAAARVRASLALATVDEVLADPELSIAYAAREVAKWNPQSLDFAAIAADYYSAGVPNAADANQQAFVDRVVQTRNELAAAYPVAVMPAPGELPGQLLGVGHAAYYSPSYDRAWWERTLQLYQSWNLIAPNWANDPNGYYCVRPGYVPGYKLQLVANGVTITCTVGDMVADPHLGSWLAHWVIEMNWEAFTALGLDRNNTVEVYHVGETAPPPIPEVPVETPTPEPTPAETPTPEPSPTPAETPVTETPVPAPTEPAATPTPEPVAPTETPQPTPTSEPTATPAATATPSPTTEPGSPGGNPGPPKD